MPLQFTHKEETAGAFVLSRKKREEKKLHFLPPFITIELNKNRKRKSDIHLPPRKK